MGCEGVARGWEQSEVRYALMVVLVSPCRWFGGVQDLRQQIESNHGFKPVQSPGVNRRKLK